MGKLLHLYKWQFLIKIAIKGGGSYLVTIAIVLYIILLFSCKTKQNILMYTHLQISTIYELYLYLRARANGPFKYYVSMFLAFLGPPTHLRQHK